jgi:hypothetical protein
MERQLFRKCRATSEQPEGEPAESTRSNVRGGSTGEIRLSRHDVGLRSNSRHCPRDRWKGRCFRRCSLGCEASCRPPVICPTGSLLRYVSSSFRKNISLNPSGKSSLQTRPVPSRKRGVGHRHERWDGMRWTRQRRARDVTQGGLRLVSDNGVQTIDVAAYGEAVWSWHPLLVSSRRRFCRPDRVRQDRQSADDGDKTNSSPGRARNKPLKPLCRECRMMLVNLW